MAATTGQLGLVTPTQGTLSGTWGDTVNNGITEYVNIAIAGTLSFANDGAITLANTTGDASASNIGSTTAQYAAIRVTGTLTTTKVITAPSYSKTYVVENAATGGTVTFKASGQTGVSIAVGEKALVYFNGTDYVKVSSSVADGVTTISFGSTGLTPATDTSGAVTVAGTLAIANGGTGITSFGTGVATWLGTPSSANLASAVTGETGTGALVFGTAPALGNPTVTNYVETAYSANSSTAITLDLANGTVQNITLTGSPTITMPTAALGKSFILYLRTGSGSYSVTWSTVKWAGGTAPTVTSTASRMDIYSFFADNSNWYGVTVAQNYTP
jgi:hypothetical protein